MRNEYQHGFKWEPTKSIKRQICWKGIFNGFVSLFSQFDTFEPNIKFVAQFCNNLELIFFDVRGWS